MTVHLSSINATTVILLSEQHLRTGDTLPRLLLQVWSEHTLK